MPNAKQLLSPPFLGSQDNKGSETASEKKRERPSSRTTLLPYFSCAIFRAAPHLTDRLEEARVYRKPSQRLNPKIHHQTKPSTTTAGKTSLLMVK